MNIEGLSQDLLYKIEVPSNRYDLLCQEGIVMALRIFLQKDTSPSFQLSGPATQQMKVHPGT